MPCRFPHWRAFTRDRSGTVAIAFAIAAIPLFLAIGLAVDFGRALTAKRAIQETIDAAALAAATFGASGELDANDSKINSRRREIADALLKAGLADKKLSKDVKYEVRFQNGGVEIVAKATIPTTIGALVMPNINIAANALALTAKKTVPLCILALNESASGTFEARSSAALEAPECAVHSNSKNNTGMLTANTAALNAIHFCSSGGHSGKGFSPAPVDDCTQHDDPYEDKYTLSALQSDGINLDKRCDYTKTLRVKKDIVFDAGGPKNVMLFCGGLNVNSNRTATFEPGIYVFDRTLQVRKRGKIEATEDVTFFFLEGAQLNVQARADFLLTAPTSGPLAGMAIAQPDVSGYSGGTRPAVTNKINAGGQIDIVGNVYMPEAKLLITGSGEINGDSTYFSIIADFVELNGNSLLNVANEPTNNNMPSIGSSGTGIAYLAK